MRGVRQRGQMFLGVGCVVGVGDVDVIGPDEQPVPQREVTDGRQQGAIEANAQQAALVRLVAGPEAERVFIAPDERPGRPPLARFAAPLAVHVRRYPVDVGVLLP